MKRSGFLIPLSFLGALAAALPASAAPSLAGVSSFGYQLQHANVSRLVTSPYDLVIIDYSKDGSERGVFSPAEIGAVKASGKKVLAYLSIGEAEEYRYYFRRSWVKGKRSAPCGRETTRRAPVWLDRSNAAWCGNYKVRYWLRAWQRIVYGVKHGRRKSYLDRIIDAGFDGVYLDIVDGYEYWLDKPRASRRRTAAADMASFVVKLGQYARRSRGMPDFIVVPQNGAGIISEVSRSLRKRYLRSIQAIGAEDTFYYGRRDEDNPLAPQSTIKLLAEFLAAGKKVFAVDYLRDDDKILNFARLACSYGFIPQVANRELDSFDTEVLLGCNCISTENGLVC